jgi:hypothetical protein
MLINDKINKCTVYNKYFIDDLVNYTLDESNNALTIKYADGNNAVVDFSRLEGTVQSIINSYKAANEKKDCWYPAIVTKDNSNTLNKDLIKGFAINFDNLGIESSISFDAKFQNWTTSTPVKMSVDWIINSPIIPFKPKYGVLFWYKSNTVATSKPLSEIPNESRLVCESEISFTDPPNTTTGVRKYISPLCIVRKLDDDTLYVEQFEENVDKNDITFVNNNTVVKQKDRIFSISAYLSSAFPKTANETEEAYQNRLTTQRNNIKFKPVNSGKYPLSNMQDISLYISNGEAYSYTTDDEELASNYSNNMPMRSYVSVTQYQFYRQIYDILTLDLVKKVDAGLDPSYARRMKKLAHVLSTFPQIDRTTQSILLHEDIRKYIKDTYLAGPVSSFNMELNSLLNAIRFITPYFSDHVMEPKQSNYSTNFIRSKKDLFNKLISKYNAQVKMDQAVTFRYNNGLKYGPHVKINQGLSSKCAKELSGAVIYNNMSVKAGNMNIETAFTDSSTSIIAYDARNREDTKTIPLWDIKRKTLINPSLTVSAGPDLIIPMKYVEEYNERGFLHWVMVETDYQLPAAVSDDEISEGDKPKIEWSRLSGSDCVRFSDTNITKNYGDRYAISTEYAPTLYIKKPGKYTLKVKVSTGFGIVYDNVIIYAVDSGINQQSPPPQQAFYAPNKRPGALRPARVKEIRPENGTIVMCPNIREFAIGKQGIFYPTYTDCTIYTRDIDKAGRAYKLENFNLKIGIPVAGVEDGNVPFSITYKPNNTTMNLSRMIIRNMMDKNDDCFQCESFYKNIVNSEGQIVDAGNGGITIMNPMNNNMTENLYTGKLLSTSYSKIISYGGYSTGILNDLNVNIPFHLPPNIQLPSITGTTLDGPKDSEGKLKHFCHLTNVNYDQKFEFHKGCFDPNIGWRTDDLMKNKTSVIKFDPGRRRALVFKGQGFSNIEHDFVDNNPSFKILSSRITLAGDTNLVGDCPAPEQRSEERDSDPCPSSTIQALDRIEINDHQESNGYRLLSNSDLTRAKYSDEFSIDLALSSEGYINVGDPGQQYCTNQDSNAPLYNTSYIATRRGSYLPEKDRQIQRFGRQITGAKIKDIEVQLNFLNYANPKDLVIWLDIEPSASHSKAIFPKQGKPRDRFSFLASQPYVCSPFDKNYVESYNQIQNIQNVKLKNYLLALLKMNENPGPAPDPAAEPEEYDPLRPKSLIYRLYLLNQDNIEAASPNCSIKFSDHAYKNTVASDNSNNRDPNPVEYTAIEKNGIINLLPTVSASGLSELDTKIFTEVLRTNNLHLIGNRFGKFRELPLFTDYDNVAGWGSCSFTLNMGLVNETDLMTSCDLVSGSEYIAGIDKITVENKSNILENSLCSWDLILHTSDNTNNFIAGDSFGEIDYLSPEPQFSGYNYICDFTNKEYMVPFVNLNAPNNFLFTSNCIHNKEELNIPTFLPTQYNLLPLVLVTPQFSIVGAIAETISVDTQLNAIVRGIVDMLNDISRTQAVAVFNQNLYVPKYEKYSFGSPEKALLNVSKDGYVWYKLEASFFRYMNTLPVKKASYNFIKLHRDSLRPLSIFDFSIIKLPKEFITGESIKNIYIPVVISDLGTLTADSLYASRQTTIETKEELERSIRENNEEPNEETLKRLKDLEDLIQGYSQTISSIGYKIYDGDTLELQKQENKDENGLYGATISSNNTTLTFTKMSPPEVSYTAFYLQKNCMTDIRIRYTEETIPAENPDDPPTIKTVVNENKTIKIQSIRPYFLFDKNETIYTLKTSDEIIAEYLADDNKSAAEQLQNEIKNLETQIDTAIKNKRPQKEIENLQEQLWQKQNVSHENKILHKGYMIQGGLYYTVLTMESVLAGSKICKKPDLCDAAILFKSDRTTIEGTAVPFDIWSMTMETNLSNEIISKTPDESACIYGEGSYGNGTPLNRPLVLSSQESVNRPKVIKDIVDLRKTDTKKNISVTPYISGVQQSDTVLSDVYGYSYRDEDIGYLINAQEQIFISKLTEDNAAKLKSYLSDIKNYTTKNSAGCLMDIKSSSINSLTSNNGKITIHNDMTPIYDSYKFTQAEVTTMKNRLTFLDGPITLDVASSRACSNSTDPDCVKNYLKSQNINNLSISDLNFYVNNVGADPVSCNSLTIGSAVPNVCRVILANNKLNDLNIEKNNIVYYMEKGGVKKQLVAIPPSGSGYNYIAYTGVPTIPQIKYQLTTDSDNSLKFSEGRNDSHYWMNIDPEQGCSRDKMAGPKILLKVVQACQPVSFVAGSPPLLPFTLPHICNAFPHAVHSKDISGPDVNFRWNGPDYTFITNPAKIKEQIAKYPDAPWPELKYNQAGSDMPVELVNGTENAGCILSFQRSFWMSMAGEDRNALVYSTETYLIPKDIDKSNFPKPDGQVENKVKNIFNLNEDDTLYVKFKNIPRKLRSIDTQFDTYRPNKLGQLTKSIMQQGGGPVYDNMVMWQCIDAKTGGYIEPPTYYKWMNEMIFRAYFGSVDGAENKGALSLRSQDPSDWIPFELT